MYIWPKCHHKHDMTRSDSRRLSLQGFVLGYTCADIFSSHNELWPRIELHINYHCFKNSNINVIIVILDLLVLHLVKAVMSSSLCDPPVICRAVCLWALTTVGHQSLTLSYKHSFYQLGIRSRLSELSWMCGHSRNNLQICLSLI